MLPIVKAHAYGNDFLYVTESDIVDRMLDPVELAVDVCKRHTGVGADGLIVYSRTDAGARMRLINQDGSHAEVSGNGVRGLAALLARASRSGAPAQESRVFVIETDAGVKRLELLRADGESRFEFRAEMGPPRDVARVVLDVAGEQVEVTRLNMGNPQCVLLARLDDERLERLGRALQHHPAFPDAVNFELAEVVVRDSLRILIWERGVGRTRSSGTGSCAAAVAAMNAGLLDRDATVEAPGGTQRVEWRDETVWLTGWAEVVLEGDWLRGILRDTDAA